MVGLDAAGKTTILYKLKLGEGKEYATDLGRKRLQLNCLRPTR
jgi:hypothetical protein